MINLVLTHGPRVVMAIVVLIVGLWIIRALGRALVKMMNKREVDPSLIPFLKGLSTTLPM